MPEDKTFYNIVDLSENFKKFEAAVLGGPEAAKVMDKIQVYQVRTQLCIAQQLSVISGTLSDLLALCKKQSPKA